MREKEREAGSSPEEASLLLRLHTAPSQEDWKTLVDLYTPVVYRFCRRHGLQDADALDVVQNVFMRTHRAMRTFQYDRRRGVFRSWLCTVAANEIRRDHKKRLAARQIIHRVSHGGRLEESGSQARTCWDEEFRAELCRMALDRLRVKLKPQNWQAFELIWSEGRKPEAVARLLGKPVTWVYKVKYKIVRRLKEEVDRLAAASHEQSPVRTQTGKPFAENAARGTRACLKSCSSI